VWTSKVLLTKLQLAVHTALLTMGRFPDQPWLYRSVHAHGAQLLTARYCLGFMGSRDRARPLDEWFGLIDMQLYAAPCKLAVLQACILFVAASPECFQQVR